MPTSVSTLASSKQTSEVTIPTSVPESKPRDEEVTTPTVGSCSAEHERQEVSNIDEDDSFVTPESVKATMHPMHTPAINKRRQATKHIVVNSPTDNIFSPISQKLLGRKRNDPARELPDA